MENVYNEIDDVIEKMQAAIEKKREQKYPMQLIKAADEQDIRMVEGNWSLPEEYLYFLKHYVPESVYWHTDEYMNLHIYGAKDMLQGQFGYNYNPVTNEAIMNWPSDYLVIAADEGNPYCIDLSRGDTVIYTAEHGTGSWDFSIAYDNLVEFLHSALLPDSSDEWEAGENEQFDYFKVLITGAGTDRVKTLMFIKKRFSCDYAQAKTYLESTPLLVFKGIERDAANIENQLKSIGTDYELRKISLEEFLN